MALGSGAGDRGEENDREKKKERERTPMKAFPRSPGRSWD